MNKYQEAYEYRHLNIKSHLLKELVELHTPKKVLKINKNNIYIDRGFCPSCDNLIDLRHKYCPYCGQALDWEVYYLHKVNTLK